MPYPHRVSIQGDEAIITIRAWDNMRHYRVTVPAEAYYEWKNGGLIQDCFPSMHVDIRELLISGTSPEDLHGIFQEPRS